MKLVNLIWLIELPTAVLGLSNGVPLLRVAFLDAELDIVQCGHPLFVLRDRACRFGANISVEAGISGSRLSCHAGIHPKCSSSLEPLES